MNATLLASVCTLLTGTLFLCWTVLSMRPDSRLRRLYGVGTTDARSGPRVVGLCGLGICALAGAIYFSVSERIVGTVTVVVSAWLCIVFGWLVRYRDRRELLTTPDVDRTTAHRLGGVAILCGVVVLPLGPAIWLQASPGLLFGIALGGSFVSLFAIAYAYR